LCVSTYQSIFSLTLHTSLMATSNAYPQDDEYINKMLALLKPKLSEVYKGTTVRRDAHPKCLGLLKAEFTVEKDLPEHLKVGVFAEPRTYSALIRMSNASGRIQSDKAKDLRGFAIKLLGVVGERYSQAEKTTQDFLLINYPVIPIGTVKLFHDFVYYSVKYHPLLFILKLLFTGKSKIVKQLQEASQNHTSLLDIRFWSTTPYQLGKNIIKFSIVPTSKYQSALPNPLTDNYLTNNAQQHLHTTEATFDFMVQLQTNPATMPIDDSGVEWQESESPYIKVATLRIPQQTFDTPERFDLAEHLSFSPEHALKVHQPIGSMNRARYIIYRQISEFRHQKNAKLLIEPNEELFNKLQ
jgi:hypothetical protein